MSSVVELFFVSLERQNKSTSNFIFISTLIGRYYYIRESVFMCCTYLFMCNLMGNCKYGASVKALFYLSGDPVYLLFSGVSALSLSFPCGHSTSLEFAGAFTTFWESSF